MNYTLIWSTRNRVQELLSSLDTADHYFPKSVNFLLSDAGSTKSSLGCIREEVHRLSHLRDVRIIESPKRTTLSQAWNIGMMLADTDFFIFSSSDVVFKSDKLFKRFVLEYERTNSPYILSDNHAVFMLHKSIIKTVGWFDEDFVLGPHFDTDFMIRAQEAGISLGNVPSNGMYEHSDTDEETILRSTVGLEDRLPMNDYTNDTIFKEKWKTDWPGWKPFSEQVSKPHPPNHISHVTRLKPEINWHPGYQ